MEDDKDHRSNSGRDMGDYDYYQYYDYGYTRPSKKPQKSVWGRQRRQQQIRHRQILLGGASDAGDNRVPSSSSGGDDDLVSDLTASGSDLYGSFDDGYCDTGISIALVALAVLGVAVMFFVLLNKINGRRRRRRREEEETGWTIDKDTLIEIIDNLHEAVIGGRSHTKLPSQYV